MSKKQTLSLSPTERRASIALAGLFAARMLGLFLLLPVFAVAARGLPGDVYRAATVRTGKLVR